MVINYTHTNTPCENCSYIIAAYYNIKYEPRHCTYNYVNNRTILYNIKFTICHAIPARK